MIETRRFSSSAKNFVTRNVNAIAIFRVQKSKHAFASHPISHVLLAKILFLYTDLSSSGVIRLYSTIWTTSGLDLYGNIYKTKFIHTAYVYYSRWKKNIFFY